MGKVARLGRQRDQAYQRHDPVRASPVSRKALTTSSKQTCAVVSSHLVSNLTQQRLDGRPGVPLVPPVAPRLQCLPQEVAGPGPDVLRSRRAPFQFIDVGDDRPTASDAS